MNENDWKEVVELAPKGYVEFNNGEVVIHGPVERVTVDDGDMVHIKMEWAAIIKIDDIGLPEPGGIWERADTDELVFPNFIVPFVVEDTPRKGERVRFGMSFIYIKPVESNVKIGKRFGT